MLYFSIVKSPSVPGALLGSALEGLACFAHRVNVDFFRDLLSVLRAHIIEARTAIAAASSGSLLDGDEDGEELRHDTGAAEEAIRRNSVREALLCLVTAFELLSGQGEALNIDLSDFIAHLYALILPLALSPTIEERPAVAETLAAAAAGAAKGKGPGNGKGKSKPPSHLGTEADLLFRAVDLALLRPRASTVPAERSAAFTKRLLSASLHWPPTSILRALGVCRTLLARETRLDALWDSEDRARDGVFERAGEDPEAARPLAAGEAVWELALLERHVNGDVREKARELATWVR